MQCRLRRVSQCSVGSDVWSPAAADGRRRTTPPDGAELRPTALRVTPPAQLPASRPVSATAACPNRGTGRKPQPPGRPTHEQARPNRLNEPPNRPPSLTALTNATTNEPGARGSYAHGVAVVVVWRPAPVFEFEPRPLQHTSWRMPSSVVHKTAYRRHYKSPGPGTRVLSSLRDQAFTSPYLPGRRSQTVPCQKYINS